MSSRDARRRKDVHEAYLKKKEMEKARLRRRRALRRRTLAGQLNPMNKWSKQAVSHVDANRLMPNQTNSGARRSPQQRQPPHQHQQQGRQPPMAPARRAPQSASQQRLQGQLPPPASGRGSNDPLASVRHLQRSMYDRQFAKNVGPGRAAGLPKQPQQQQRQPQQQQQQPRGNVRNTRRITREETAAEALILLDEMLAAGRITEEQHARRGRRIYAKMAEWGIWEGALASGKSPKNAAQSVRIWNQQLEVKTTGDAPTPTTPVQARRASRLVRHKRVCVFMNTDRLARDPSQLSFSKGDVVEVLNKYPSGWVRGLHVKSGRVGIFDPRLSRVATEAEVRHADATAAHGSQRRLPSIVRRTVERKQPLQKSLPVAPTAPERPARPAMTQKQRLQAQQEARLQRQRDDVYRRVHGEEPPNRGQPQAQQPRFGATQRQPQPQQPQQQQPQRPVPPKRPPRPDERGGGSHTSANRVPAIRVTPASVDATVDQTLAALDAWRPLGSNGSSGARSGAKPTAVDDGSSPIVLEDDAFGDAFAPAAVRPSANVYEQPLDDPPPPPTHAQEDDEDADEQYDDHDYEEDDYGAPSDDYLGQQEEEEEDVLALDPDEVDYDELLGTARSSSIVGAPPALDDEEDHGGDHNGAGKGDTAAAPATEQARASSGLQVPDRGSLGRRRRSTRSTIPEFDASFQAYFGDWDLGSEDTVNLDLMDQLEDDYEADLQEEGADNDLGGAGDAFDADDALGDDAFGTDALGDDAFGTDALGDDAFGTDALGDDYLGDDALDAAAYDFGADDILDVTPDAFGGDFGGADDYDYDADSYASAVADAAAAADEYLAAEEEVAVDDVAPAPQKAAAVVVVDVDDDDDDDEEADYTPSELTECDLCMDALTGARATAVECSVCGLFVCGACTGSLPSESVVKGKVSYLCVECELAMLDEMD